jgi:hypothetical protein
MLLLDRLLKHQYYARNYQHYSELIHDLLESASRPLVDFDVLNDNLIK